MTKKLLLSKKEIDGNAFHYVDQYLSLSKVGPGGQPMVAAEIFQAKPVVEKLEAAKASGADHVLLEEAEWTYVNERVKAWKYPFYHIAWFDFITATAAAKTVEITEAVGGDDAGG